MNEWSAPDMGGAIYLSGEEGGFEAVVVLDPTGETKTFLWSVNIDEYATSVAGGWAQTEQESKSAACAALYAYELEVGAEDYEPTEEQLLAQTPLARYQKQTEYLVREWEKEKRGGR